jgi:hypothetical protein
MIDNDDKIKTLELRKNTFMLSFINELSTSDSTLGDIQSLELFQKYSEYYKDIQIAFFNLYTEEQ